RSYPFQQPACRARRFVHSRKFGSACAPAGTELCQHRPPRCAADPLPPRRDGRCVGARTRGSSRRWVAVRHGAASPPAAEQRGHTAPTLRSAQGDGYGSGSMSGSGSRSRRRWGVAAFALSVVVALAVLDHARARKAKRLDPTALTTTDVTTL